MYLALHHQRQGSTEQTAWRGGLDTYTEGRYPALVVAAEREEMNLTAEESLGFVGCYLGAKARHLLVV